MGFRNTADVSPGVQLARTGVGDATTRLVGPDVLGGNSGAPPPRPVYKGGQVAVHTDGTAGSEIFLQGSMGTWFKSQADATGVPDHPEWDLYAWRGVIRQTGRDWVGLALLNGWATSGGQNLRWMRDAAGRVELRGRVAGGTTGVVGVMPRPDLMPEHLVEFACKANNDATTMCWVNINHRNHATAPGQINVVGNVAAAQVQLILDVSFSALGPGFAAVLQ